MLEDVGRVPAPLQALVQGTLILGLVYLLIQRLKTEVRRRKLISSHGCKPPTRFPVWDPVFGIDVMYKTAKAHSGNTMLSTVRTRHAQYGMTHSSRIANIPTISTIEPENLKAVFSTYYKDFHVGPPRRRAFGPVVTNSIFVADGVEWEHSRAFLRPSFNKSQVNDLETLEIHIQHFLETIPKDGSTVDLAERFLRYTADVTTDLMFGESIFSLSHPDAFGGDLSNAFHDAQVGVERRFILGKFANIVPQRQFYRSVKKVHAYVDTHVEKAVQKRLLSQEKVKENNVEEKVTVENVQDDARHIFSKELAKLTDDRLILRDQLLGIFLAGRDTTAALLANLFFVLSRNIEVWQRLHEEVHSLEGRKPTLSDLKKLKYLNDCVNETLRLYPVAFGTSRVAVNDVVLPKGGGDDAKSPIFVRKGTLISMHFHALHRRRDVWGPDADDFRPERWQEEIAPWIFLPFGGGPRNCIGQQLALTETSYTAVRLIQHFSRIESRDSRPWTENIGAVCTSKNGVKVALMP